MNIDYRKTASLLTAKDNILIISHRRPDGDTIGCAAALCLGLRNLGKAAYILPNPDTNSLFLPYLEGKLARGDFVPDYVVAVDIAGKELYTQNSISYIDRLDLCIDHHASNEGLGKDICLDITCASCGELLFDILKEMGPVTPEIALPLYVAVSTDTGCFVYNNTTARSHRVAAALMDLGIDYKWANKRHFRTKSYKRLKIESMITDQMERFDGGTVVIATVTLDMMRALSATEEDVEDISAFVGQIEGAQTAVTLREIQPLECKISVRTLGGVNANSVCALLGGGGHEGAGGCTVFDTVPAAKAAILAAIRTVKNR
ncbi:Bifunctional oligoribonuclease and PAP phosphatase NrnA [bioreactor metagenome]|uniref:Bifunctional oligoribonuclease and PAP phosphatase NrnA n=1 Tax=bioreactor metagenome TaxID=1076179 RepID=A0A644WKZ9_9ZZZZ